MVEGGDVRKVLRMTLSTPGMTPAQVESHVSGFLQFAREMNLDVSRQWMLSQEGGVLTACSCLESPGRAVMLFIPASGTAGGQGVSPRAEIARKVVDDEARRGQRLAQCLIEPGDSDAEAALRMAGFEIVAELIYMECGNPAPLRRGMHAASSDSDVSCVCYDESRHLQFAALLERTYVGSLDCPGLQGLRETEDIIAGHKAAGRFAPHRWLMLLKNNRPAGCIFLCEHPLRRIVELVYMGVSPDFRGQGLAANLLARGLELAHHEDFEKVTLAVDSKNEPALRLYRRFGFTETLRRVAMVRALHSTSARS